MPVMMINNIVLFVGMPLIAGEALHTVCVTGWKKSVAENVCINCLLVK